MARRIPRAADSTEFLVDGLRVVLIRKKVKNINLRVKGPDGHAQVSAPSWVPQDEVARFVRTKAVWIKRRQEALVRNAGQPPVKPTPQETRQWREELKPKVEALIAKWQPLIGVKATSLVFRTMTSRWGSCNPRTGRICINTRLVAYPPQCLEYIVVHELCHLIERGHGPAFKALLDRYLPDWKLCRALLRSKNR